MRELNEDINMVDIDIELLNQTDLAIHVYDGSRIAWIPKSQIEDPEDMSYYGDGESLTITVPEWLAREKELI